MEALYKYVFISKLAWFYRNIPRVCALYIMPSKTVTTTEYILPWDVYVDNQKHNFYNMDILQYYNTVHQNALYVNSALAHQPIHNYIHKRHVPSAPALTHQASLGCQSTSNTPSSPVIL